MMGSRHVLFIFAGLAVSVCLTSAGFVLQTLGLKVNFTLQYNLPVHVSPLPQCQSLSSYNLLSAVSIRRSIHDLQ